MEHTVGIKSDRTLWAWGGNRGGQLGDGTDTPKEAPVQESTGAATWSTISASWEQTIALKSDGTLWAWGDNDYGQLGDGTNIDKDTPTQIGSAMWSAISAGADHTVAVKPNGTLWAWGRNNYGQFGDGSNTDKDTPTQIGATPGALTFVEVSKDTDVGVDGLNGAWSVTVSPDARHVYVAGHDEDAVAVFDRDTTTGALTWVEVHRDGVDGVDGLDGVRSVTISPDGNHLYAASPLDKAVSVYSIATTTGALTWMEVHRDGVDGVDGLDGANSVTVSPDGSHLFTVGYNDDAVAVFRRNPDTGELTFVEVSKDTDVGVDGLNGAWSVTVSPDAHHVYVAGSEEDAVAVFAFGYGTLDSTFGTGGMTTTDFGNGGDAAYELLVIGGAPTLTSVSVPGLSHWGLIALAILMGGVVGLWRWRGWSERHMI